MLVALLVLVVLLTAALVALAAILVGDRVLRPRRRVLVNLRDDTAVEGVLWKRTRRWLVVRGAMLHQAGGNTPADGEVLVPRENVTFVQLAG